MDQAYTNVTLSNKREPLFDKSRHVPCNIYNDEIYRGQIFKKGVPKKKKMCLILSYFVQEGKEIYFGNGWMIHSS